ncbi:hypothetical protein BK717_28650 [Bacillus thuringiensis serovar malayensis]|nr:hypothetical protein BK717_28650 [Bacillus thuringiensis serovar malayensis]
MFYVSYIFYKFLRISYVYYQTKSHCVEKLVVYYVTTSFFVCKQVIPIIKLEKVEKYTKNL